MEIENFEGCEIQKNCKEILRMSATFYVEKK